MSRNLHSMNENSTKNYSCIITLKFQISEHVQKSYELATTHVHKFHISWIYHQYNSSKAVDIPLVLLRNFMLVFLPQAQASFIPIADFEWRHSGYLGEGTRNDGENQRTNRNKEQKVKGMGHDFVEILCRTTFCLLNLCHLPTIYLCTMAFIYE